MSFPYNIYAIAVVGGALGTALTLPLWRRWCARTGLVDDPGHRKIHRTPIPLAGGLGVLTGMLLPLVACAVALCLGDLLPSPPAASWPVRPPAEFVLQLFGYGFARRAPQLLAIFSGAIGMVMLGWLDDRYELRPVVKFAGQFLVASLVAAAGVRITLFVDNALFSYAVTVFWILTVTNACNFMDNMNGLCAGLGFIGAWFFAWSAAAQGQFLVASLGFLTCGALFGFLPYNFPRAVLFLGDAGSHLVGYLLAVLAILPHFYSRLNPEALAVLKPLLILAVILGDLVWVVIWRWQHGRPFYLGDTNHLSHRLVRRGLTPAAAVLVIWLAAAAMGALAFLLT